MGGLILAIDQGTTSTTCLVVEIGTEGRLVVRGKSSVEVPQHFPEPGFVEHDHIELWQTVEQATIKALEQAEVSGKNLSAIGITNQRETTGLWDEQGVPLSRAIVWQDRRTTEHCQKLIEKGCGTFVHQQTGLIIDPYFSATKIAYLLDTLPEARQRAERGQLRFGTIDTWLVWKLTNGARHVTDATNAARTMLYDIHRQQWQRDLCAMFGDIPQQLLPEVHDSSEVYGHTKGLHFLPDGIPIAGIAGDQQAALFGQACFTPGSTKCTYGTGAFALMNTGSLAKMSHHGLITTIAWRLAGKTTYALEGSTFVAGALIQWLRDGLGLIEQSSDIEALAESVTDNAGVICVPAFTGLGAPHWRPDVQGAMFGLTRGTTKAHVARAALEGIALQIVDLLTAIRADFGESIQELRVDGGAAANNLLMQFQANMLDVTIHRSAIPDITAFGAACLAGLGIGLFGDLSEVAKAWHADRTFVPSMSDETRSHHLKRWHRALQRLTSEIH